jgi:hypothetical protein
MNILTNIFDAMLYFIKITFTPMCNESQTSNCWQHQSKSFAWWQNHHKKSPGIYCSDTSLVHDLPATRTRYSPLPIFLKYNTVRCSFKFKKFYSYEKYFMIDQFLSKVETTEHLENEWWLQTTPRETMMTRHCVTWRSLQASFELFSSISCFDFR